MIKKSNPVFSLDGRWLLAYGQHGDVDEDLCLISDIEKSGMKIIPAEIPGNFELDLERAGIVPEIFYAQNIYKLYEYETCHMFYYRTFEYKADSNYDDMIVFEGIDCFAQVYIDGKILFESDNMLIPVTSSMPFLSEGEHEIVVHISPAVIKAREITHSPYVSSMKYNADSLYVRKAPSQYGWDIMPRAVSGGIWKHVYIDRLPKASVKNIFLQTVRSDEDEAIVKLFYNCRIPSGDIRDYTLKLNCCCEESSFSWEVPLWHTSGMVSQNVKKPKLWLPRNYGKPNLYEIKAELFHKDKLIHTHISRTGIRTVVLFRTSTTDNEGSGEFCFLINGKRVFAIGTNWVPVDAFHSRDEERLPKILPMLTELGCNIVRCWGGNVYENEIFYDYCDEYGIMVWQDFAMACAVYPQEQWFQTAIEKEVTATVLRLRHHPSIVLWAGDNECDDAYYGVGEGRNPNTNVLTRKVIPEVIRNFDYTRPYLPSSPYRDDEAYQSGAPISEAHLWGPRDYFKGEFYRTSLCHFASETGYHGCPSQKSLKRFISPDELWPCLDKKDWICHASSMESADNAPYAYRIALMWQQVETLFGKDSKATANLENFSLASQISQAEALKYFIERFRMSKWRRSGIIWWNLIDGWPQISDAIVDYYFEKKLAYWYIKNSQQPVCMMFDEPKDGKATLYVVNDTENNKSLHYKIIDDCENTLYQSKCIAEANMSVPVWEMNVGKEKKFYTICWNDGEKSSINHYFTNIIDIDLDYYISCAKRSKLII